MKKEFSIEEFEAEVLEPIAYQSPVSGEVQWAQVAGFVSVTNDLLEADPEVVQANLRDSEPEPREGGPDFDVGYTLQRMGPEGPITGLTYGWAYTF